MCKTLFAALLGLGILVGWATEEQTEKMISVSAVQDGAPAISGAWVGTWGPIGASKEKLQRLDCKAELQKPGKWEAVFWGDCGRPYRYEIKMLGRQSGDAVLFKGTVDLGEKDGGVYDWIGRATEGKFVGFYTSRKYVGMFELQRAPKK